MVREGNALLDTKRAQEPPEVGRYNLNPVDP
jgi:hypothetical protein